MLLVTAAGALTPSQSDRLYRGCQDAMPMLIDADIHISPTPQGGNSITIDELLRRMDRCGVDKAVTWWRPPYVRSEIDAWNA